jgi:prevent-host-death family protein
VELYFWRHVKSVATREFSRNPSSALREAEDRPVVITKYGQPIACIASMEYWSSLVKQAQEVALSDERIGDLRVEEVGACVSVEEEYCPEK